MRLFSLWMLHCSWWLLCHTAGYKKLKDVKKSTDGSETSVQYNSCQIHQGKSLALTVLLSTHRNSDSFYTAWLVVVQSEKWAGTPAVVRTIQTENMTWSSTVKLNVTDAHLQEPNKGYILLYCCMYCLVKYVLNARNNSWSQLLHWRIHLLFWPFNCVFEIWPEEPNAFH